MRVRLPIFRSPLRAGPVTTRGHGTTLLAAEIGLRIISASKNQTSFAHGSNFGGGQVISGSIVWPLAPSELRKNAALHGAIPVQAPFALPVWICTS